MLAEELGVKGRLRGGRENTGGPGDPLAPYLSLLTDATIARLFAIYRDDFLMFGYNFSFRGIDYT